MGTVNGDVEITLGSEDPITLQLLEDDGITPINLTGITGLTLYMRNTDDGSEKEITGAKLVVTDAANGKITLSQVATDFPAAASYRYKIKFDDAASKAHFVPDGSKWYLFVVYDVT
jgi:hypothetical protein